MIFDTGKQAILNMRLKRKVARGTVDEVRELIEQGADLMGEDNGSSLLLLALEKRNRDVVDYLIQEHPVNVNGSDKDGWTPLMYAVRRDERDLAELLINAGAEVNTESYPPLLLAARQEHFEMMDVLMRHGAEVDIKDAYGSTTLHWAAQYGKHAVVVKLLELGADISVVNKQGNMASHLSSEAYPGITALLQEHERMLQQQRENSDTRWKLTQDDEVCRVTEKHAIGYKITEIFNFTAKTYTQIAQNLVTNAESQSLRFFNEFPDARVLTDAWTELSHLGGKAPFPSTSIGGVMINKKPLPNMAGK